MAGFEQAPPPERFRQHAEINGIEIVLAEVPEQADYELFIGDERESIRISKRRDVAETFFEEVKRLAVEAAGPEELLQAAKELSGTDAFPYDRSDE
jgi:hypothetical protein